MEQVKQGTKEIKGKRTSMIDFVKAALQLQPTNIDDASNIDDDSNTNSTNES